MEFEINQNSINEMVEKLNIYPSGEDLQQAFRMGDTIRYKGERWLIEDLLNERDCVGIYSRRNAVLTSEEVNDLKKQGLTTLVVCHDIYGDGGLINIFGRIEVEWTYFEGMKEEEIHHKAPWVQSFYTLLGLVHKLRKSSSPSEVSYVVLFGEREFIFTPDNPQVVFTPEGDSRKETEEAKGTIRKVRGKDEDYLFKKDISVSHVEETFRQARNWAFDEKGHLEGHCKMADFCAYLYCLAYWKMWFNAINLKENKTTFGRYLLQRVFADLKNTLHVRTFVNHLKTMKELYQGIENKLPLEKLNKKDKHVKNFLAIWRLFKE